MASTSCQSLTQYHRSSLLQEAGVALLLSLLLIVFSGSGASPDLNTEDLRGHADFTPAHDSVYLPAQQHLLLNARYHPDPEDFSDPGDDAALPYPATASRLCSSFPPRHTSSDLQRPLLQSSACPARAPPLFS